MGEAMGSMDCPDCQFQLLQQQSLGSTIEIPDDNQVHQVAHEITQSNRNPSESISLWTEGRSKPSSSLSQEMMTGHYQLGHSLGNGSRIPNSSSQSSCLNIYSYSNDAGNIQTNTGGNNAPSASLPNGSVGMSITPQSTLQVNEMNQPPSVPIEPCDYNGYCSTCAVLELPTNDKFYRPQNSRPHVFPPIFYTQATSSVIPCFSPIPDCPWGNEYNLYGYAPPYSQSSSTSSVQNDYYGSSNVNNSSTMLSSEPSNMANYQTSSSIPYSVSTPYNNNIRTECRMEAQGSEPPSVSKSTPTSLRKSECSSGSVVLMPNQSSTSSDADTDNDSSCGSDGSDSILSEDRELISVVEDDENDNAKASSEPFNAERSHNKCWICHNTLGISACSSPQLAKILENIDGEIMAEDLDISVSSDDIEIEGIDDEVKDFPHKKEHSSSQVDVSLSRLSTLIGFSLQNHSESQSQKDLQSDSDLVCLCFRCGKLVLLADSLEQQLTVAVNKLHQQILDSQSTQELSTLVTQSRLLKGDGQTQSLVPGNRRHIDKSTQIGDEINRFEIEINATNTTNNSNGDDEENSKNIIGILNINSENKASGNASSLCNPAGCSPLQNDGVLTVSSIVLIDSNLMMSPNPTGLKEKSSQVYSDCLDHPHNPDELVSSSTMGAEIVANPNSSFSTQIQSKIIIEESHAIKIVDDILTNKPLASNVDPFCEDQLPKNQAGSYTKIDPLVLPIQKKCQNVPLICIHCKRKFSSKSNLRAHDSICKFKSSHREADGVQIDKMDMKCVMCGIGFRSAIRRHLHMEQGCKTIVFECEYCSKRFSKNSELKVHLLIHQGEKCFKCDICGTSFSTKGNQVAHSKTHSNNKSYPCTLCEKGFNRRYALLMHMNRHNGAKPFSCKICKKGFADPSNLKNHQKKSHQDKNLVPVGIM